MDIIGYVTETNVNTNNIKVVDDSSESGHGIIKIMRVPEDDDYPTVDEFHDVIIRGDDRDDVIGPFDRKDAVKKAVEVADSTGYHILDAIYRYNPYDPADRAEYTRRFGKLDDIATYDTSTCPDCGGEIEVDWGDAMDVGHKCVECGEEFELVEVTYLRRS